MKHRAKVLRPLLQTERKKKTNGQMRRVIKRSHSHQLQLPAGIGTSHTPSFLLFATPFCHPSSTWRQLRKANPILHTHAHLCLCKALVCRDHTLTESPQSGGHVGVNVARVVGWNFLSHRRLRVRLKGCRDGRRCLLLIYFEREQQENEPQRARARARMRVRVCMCVCVCVCEG